MTAPIKKFWKNEYFQTAVVVIVIVSLGFGFWYGSQIVLNTKIPPELAVVSGSMDTISDGAAPGWAHPFARTLQIGDIIIIQGVNPKDLNTNYPNSDIIVFHDPQNPSELIVHRIIATTVVNGTIYFETKGDGNGNPWPQTPQYGLDPWDYGSPAGVPQNLVVGKVIMRIPLIGYIPMFIHDTLGANNANVTIPIIIVLIALLVIIEFIIPLFNRQKKKELPTTQETNNSGQLTNIIKF